MERLTLTQKVAGLVALGWVVSAGTTGYLILRLHSVSADYARIFQTEVHEQVGTRALQVTFKKQVQEWKDILLRGSSATALQQHKTGFEQREREVHDQAAALRSQASDSSVARVLDQFQQAHQAMGNSYRAALAVFTASRRKSPYAADRMVQGQDRAPTNSWTRRWSCRGGG